MIDSHGVREDRVRGVPHIGEGLLGRPQAQIRITNLGTYRPRYRMPRTPARWRSSCFDRAPATDSPKCRVWICRNLVETDVADDLIGPVEPGVPEGRSRPPAATWGPAADEPPRHSFTQGSRHGS